LILAPAKVLFDFLKRLLHARPPLFSRRFCANPSVRFNHLIISNAFAAEQMSLRRRRSRIDKSTANFVESFSTQIIQVSHIPMCNLWSSHRSFLETVRYTRFAGRTLGVSRAVAAWIKYI
jgi:hypothetical protein